MLHAWLLSENGSQLSLLQSHYCFISLLYRLNGYVTCVQIALFLNYFHFFQLTVYRVIALRCTIFLQWLENY